MSWLVLLLRLLLLLRLRLRTRWCYGPRLRLRTRCLLLAYHWRTLLFVFHPRLRLWLRSNGCCNAFGLRLLLSYSSGRPFSLRRTGGAFDSSLLLLLPSLRLNRLSGLRRLSLRSNGL